MKKGKYIGRILFSFTFLFFLFFINIISAWNFNNINEFNFFDSETIVKNFLDLIDTPSSYVGQGTNCLIVNAGETALEFGSCGVGGGGGGDKWVDNGTYISPNSTYANNIFAHKVSSIDWSNVSITESQISDLVHTTDSVGQNSTWEGNQTNYYNITIMNSIISGNISSLYTIINLNVSSIYSVLTNNISSIYGLITGNLSLGYAYSDTNILGNRSVLDGNILGNKSADGVGQNATFIGTNYTLNVNKSNIGDYVYYNGSTWDTSWNSTSYNTSYEIFAVVDNNTFEKVGYGYYNGSTWDTSWNSTSYNTSYEIFAVVDNSTFLKSYTENDPNWLANMSLYYNRSDITNLGYFNSSTWNNIWNVSSGGGNTTDEIFSAVNNGTFERIGHGYYNSSLINSTTFEDQGGKLGIVYSWIVGLIKGLISNVDALITGNRTAIETNILGNRSSLDVNILGNSSVGQNSTWEGNQTRIEGNIVSNGSQQWRDQSVNKSSDVNFNSINITKNTTMQTDQYLCFKNSSHNCAKWILSNNSGVYIYGG